MNDFELINIKDIFARLFVLAIKNRINLSSFTTRLALSEFVEQIEKDEYSDIFNWNIKKIFYLVTDLEIVKDESYGIFNDAYWAGLNYFNLHKKLNKSFAFIFLKLPLDQMLDIYSIYHEMDFSNLLTYFNNIDIKSSILRLLCKNRKCSLNDISKTTLIPLSTLKKYNSSDELLYKASFQNINLLKKYFDVNYSLFVNSLK